MSRHRFYQNAEDDYEDDDNYSYSSSYGTSYEEGGLSTSVENQYLYNRGRSGTTPKMSNFFATEVSASNMPEGEFEMDLEIGSGPSRVAGFEPDVDPGPSPGGRTLSRRDSGFDTSGLSSEEMMKLNSGLDYILDIVGDTIPESLIKEALVRNQMDAERALTELLDRSQKPASTASPNQLPPPLKQIKLKGLPIQESAPVIKTAVTSPAAVAVGFAAAGPVVPTPVESTASTPTIENKILEKVDKDKRSRSNSPLPRVETLSVQDRVDSRAGSPTSRGGGASEPALSTPLKQVTMRKEKIDATSKFSSERGTQKEVLNLVVVGHVDSGKSTLMGHLLFKLGNVSQKIMHKYEKESKKVGKQSFMYAWVLDETEEERSRGITMDVGTNKFETEHRIITLLDAPGHRDFIPNMISGAYQADVAVLVVNSTTGEFEAGFESGGQTREHALLVRSLGVSQLVIAVNKLDTVDWKESRFREIKDKLSAFLNKQAGFRDKDLTFIPCSGLTGENLTSPPTSDSLLSWYTGLNLVQAVDQLKSPERAVDKPFRMSISDVFKGQSGLSVNGRVEAGFVMKDDRVLCLPLNQICSVKAVLVEQIHGQTGYAGDHVTLILSGPEQSSLAAGMVLCDPGQPIPVASKFKARIVVFNIDVPITKGFPMVLHYGCVSEQATISKLISLLNKSSGEVEKAKPRCLTGSCSAVVQITVSKPIPLELYKDNRELGRFMVRTGGHTIAAGMVTEIL